MGCCQTNLASPLHPANIDPRKFIDGIKQDGSLGEGQQNNNKKQRNKKNIQTQEQYEYSVHGLRQDEQQEQSIVSIFEQQRKLKSRSNTSNGDNKMMHAEIHPQTIQNDNLKEITSNKNNQNNPSNNTKTFQQACEQFQISRIDLVNQTTNLQYQHNHLLNTGVNSTEFLKQKNNTNQLLEVKQSLKSIYNKTDRQLIELNGQIATMIVLWDHDAISGQKFILQAMKHYQEQEGKCLVEQKKQQAIENRNRQEDENLADKQLANIWNSQQNKENLQASLQPNDEEKLQLLKNQYILSPNLQQPQLNKPKQQCLLTNQKLKQKLQQPLNTQQASKQNKPSPPTKQQLKLHLSKIKSRKPQQQQPIPDNAKIIPTQQDESQNSSDNEYSRCLLSNPTRILNDSFTQQFNIQKQMFYFCSPHSYKKWIQNDRKAYEINKEVIQQFLFINQNKHLSTKQKQFTQQQNRSTQINRIFCILLSIIRDYKHLAGINLIAYRTFSSTSIFMQSQQRQTNYSGFRMFFDGTKRIYPFSQCFDCTQIGQQLHKMITHLHSSQKNPAQLLYNLTGWVSEYIVVDEINSFDGIFERLNNNFIDGNTIITFTGNQGESWGLKYINLDRQQISLYGSAHKQPLKHSHEFQQKYSWQQFINLIYSINVNWNPLIYDYVWKTENIFFLHQKEINDKDTIGDIDPQYISDKSHQYLLKIPPSDDDIELRVFLETHYEDDQHTAKQVQPLVIELYDYMGTRVHSSSSAIRKLDKNKTVYSDVLIFEGSKQRTQYVLLVRPSQRPSRMKQVKYTIYAYSFFQVAFSQLALQRVIQQKIITTFLQESHCGYGINSPHLFDNFYMQVKIPPLQRVRIFVQMPTDDCCFEINLIANPNSEQNLTRLNLQTILGEIITSDEFSHGKGYLEIQSKYDSYFMILTNHTKCKGEFKIIIQVLQKQPKALTKQKLNQLKLINTAKDQSLPQLISYKQKFFYEQPLTKKQFKWSPTNTGPRKRLKSNTHSGYQPFAIFKEFFKNPFADFKLEKSKKYQFSVTSQSYMEQFDQFTNEDKNDAEPPTLSLGILKVMRPNDYQNNDKSTGNQSSFKIVMDDAFYVPFGFGFWTKVMQFEEGEYRFVFPRMQKQGGTGTFCIYQIKQ